MNDTTYIIYSTIGWFVVLTILGIFLIIKQVIRLLELKLKLKRVEARTIRDRLHHEDLKGKTEYSDKLLEFIKTLTTQVAVLQFRTFVDAHEITKISKIHIKQVAENVAKTVHDAINMDSIDFNDTLFTKEFFEKYIIETSVNTVKSLLDKTLQQISEE